MIDLHTHTLFSDGVLLPSELVRRAVVKGYKAIALTDHADASNIDFILPRIVKVAASLNSRWPIKVIPGVEITHAPLEDLKGLIEYSRANAAGIVVVHGETVSEPVLSGTNRKAIECGTDILSHPGLITEDDALLAAKNGVCLEITTRKSHAVTNPHVKDAAKRSGARLVLNTDTHMPDDMIDDASAKSFLEALGFTNNEINAIFANSLELSKKAGM